MTPLLPTMKSENDGEDPIPLEFLRVPAKIEGTVVSYSERGNLVTDIPCATLAEIPRSAAVTICCDEHETIGLFTQEHSEPEFSFLALLGDSGFLELTIVGDSAKSMLGVGLGERVSVKW